MKTEKMRFEEKQDMLQFAESGRCLVLANETETVEEVQELESVSENGEPVYKTVEHTAYEYDACWIEGQTEKEVISNLKAALLAEITKYDSSSAVNSFVIGGSKEWIDRETRVSVTDSATKEKAYGRTETTLWLGGKEYTLPIDTVLALLTQLEIYAKDCYNVTARHKAEVEKLESVEDIMAYSINKEYPDMLTIDLTTEES